MTRVDTNLSAGSAAAVDDEEVSYAERAHAVLQRAIATCALAPGSVLNERHEAARLGMSRTPFRQALHRLAGEGLVDTAFNRTVRVSLLDPERIEHFTVIREALEVELVRRIVLEDRPVDFKRLDALLRDMAAAIKATDVISYLEADEQFHLTICSAAGNDEALEIIRRAWIHVNRTRYLEAEVMQGYRGSLTEHRGMMAGLRRGDTAEVASAIRHHMERSRSRLADLMQALPEAFVVQSVLDVT